MTTTVDNYPFRVRLENGHERSVYAQSLSAASIAAEMRHSQEFGSFSPATLAVRADEPLVRAKPKRNWLLRMIGGE